MKNIKLELLELILNLKIKEVEELSIKLYKNIYNIMKRYSVPENNRLYIKSKHIEHGIYEIKIFFDGQTNGIII